MVLICIPQKPDMGYNEINLSNSKQISTELSAPVCWYWILIIIGSECKIMIEKTTNIAQKLMTSNQNLTIRADNSVTCTDKTKWLVTVNQLILTCDLFWCISQLIRICKKKKSEKEFKCNWEFYL